MTGIFTAMKIPSLTFEKGALLTVSVSICSENLLVWTSRKSGGREVEQNTLVPDLC
jgi:hypothetical protein